MKVKKVYYKHYRYYDFNGHPDLYYPLHHYNRRKSEWQPSTKGGKTECHLVLEDDYEIVAIAECSLQDNFCYKTGRLISFGRATKQYRQWLEQIEAQKTDLQFVYTVV